MPDADSWITQSMLEQVDSLDTTVVLKSTMIVRRVSHQDDTIYLDLDILEDDQSYTWDPLVRNLIRCGFGSFNST